MGVEREGATGLPGVTLFNISAANWNKRVGLRWTRYEDTSMPRLLY